MADFANGGQKALLAKPIRGRPSNVSAEEMRWLAQAVKDRTPLQLKFAFGLWTLSLNTALIEHKFGKKLAGLGQLDHKTAGFLGAETALSGVVTGCNARARLGSRDISGHTG